MGVKMALYLFCQPAFSFYFKFAENHEICLTHGYARALMLSLVLQARLGEKNLLAHLF